MKKLWRSYEDYGTPRALIPRRGKAADSIRVSPDLGVLGSKGRLGCSCVRRYEKRCNDGAAWSLSSGAGPLCPYLLACGNEVSPELTDLGEEADVAVVGKNHEDSARDRIGAVATVGEGNPRVGFAMEDLRECGHAAGIERPRSALDREADGQPDTPCRKASLRLGSRCGSHGLARQQDQVGRCHLPGPVPRPSDLAGPAGRCWFHEIGGV